MLFTQIYSDLYNTFEHLKERSDYLGELLKLTPVGAENLNKFISIDKAVKDYLPIKAWIVSDF